MARYDLLLKGGTVIDGQRTPRYTGDIAIADGRIAQIGNVSESEATRVFDARDLIVAPGVIDLHTHFDSQIFWDPWCTMSGWHGVTSVVIGNCGFGFAPVAPEDRERAMLTLERNEAVRATTMAAGMPWDWVTFPEYLDSIERTPKGVNVLSYMGLAPVMSWVMGLENAKGRPATAEEQRKMGALLSEAMDVGACGFSAQNMGEDSVQRDYDGTPMITDIMAADDLLHFARVLGEKGRGFIQLLGGDFDLYEKVAEVSGRPVIWNNLEFAHDQHGNTYGFYRDILKWLERGNARGLRLYAHAVTCDIDFHFSLEDFNLFDGMKAWRDLTLGSVPERMAKMRDPVLRDALRAEFDRLAARRDRHPDKPVPPYLYVPEMRIAEARTEAVRPLEGYTVGEVAERENKHPIDAFLDVALSEDLGTFFTSLAPETSADALCEAINSPFVLPGVSDGGAHMKFATTGRYPTDFIGRLVRDMGLMDLEQAHWRLSGYSAMAAGFTDRGFLREGAPADVIVYDYDALRSLPPERIHDFPAGDWRLAQKAEGYRLTVVNGEVTFEDGECTGATPGTLLRHGRTG
ncbi:MAG: amidohydrolase family protein [Gammaproteobacteria bacterium]|nr:amidohydrolase family protein [Gammaproteobacteria bacterium]